MKTFKDAELGLMDGKDDGLILVGGQAGEDVHDSAGCLRIEAWGEREGGREGGRNKELFY